MSLRSEVIRIVNELLGNSKKISELPAASALTGTEQVEVNQGGTSARTTSQAIANLGGGGGSVTGADNGLYLDGTTAKTGGTMVENTFIVGDGFDLTRTGFGDHSFEAVSHDFTTPNGVAGITIIDAGTVDIKASAFAFNSDPGDPGEFLSPSGWATPAASPKVVQVAASDETSALTTGTAKVTFRMPYAMTLTAVRASLTTSQYSGNILTVDINNNGTSVLSTKLTIDNMEETSTTAVTPPVISSASLSDDTEITIDIDQVGDGTATGLKITLIGT